MSVSLGRGRASLLKRSVSTEPQRSSPGGLQDAHPTTSPPPTSSNPSPIKNIKPKLRTFQKPRPLKSRNPTSTSPLVIPDSNNNSCSSSQDSARTTPDRATPTDKNGEQAAAVSSLKPVNTNHVHCGQRLLITTSPGSVLGQEIVSRLKTDFHVTPRITDGSEGLHHMSLQLGDEKLVLTGLKSSTLVADVYKFLQDLNGSQLVSPKQAAVPTALQNGAVSSLPTINNSPPQLTDNPPSVNAARHTTLNIGAAPFISRTSITEDAGNRPQYTRSYSEPAQPAKRSFDARNLPQMNMDTTSRFPVIDLTQNSSSSTSIPEPEEEDWGDVAAGDERPAFKFGAAQLAVTTYAMNQTCNENRLVAPEGAMSKGQLKKALKAPMPARERPKIDDALKNMALNKDIRLLDQSNHTASNAAHISEQAMETEDWGDDSPTEQSVDIIIQPDPVPASGQVNETTPLHIHTGDGAEDWGSESMNSSQEPPAQSLKSPSNSRLKSDSWQTNRIFNILSGATERRKITPIRRAISTPAPNRQRKVSFADETTTSQSVSDQRNKLKSADTQSPPVYRFGACGAAAAPASDFTFNKDSSVSYGDGLCRSFTRSLSVEEKPITRPWDSAKSQKYDFDTNDWGSVRNSKACKNNCDDSTNNNTPSTDQAEDDWGEAEAVEKPITKQSSNPQSFVNPPPREIHASIQPSVNPPLQTTNPTIQSSKPDPDWASLRNSQLPPSTNEKQQHWSKPQDIHWRENPLNNGQGRVHNRYNGAIPPNFVNQNPQFSMDSGDQFRRFDTRPWSMGDNAEQQRLTFTRNNGRENWEQAKGDNWRVTAFNRPEKDQTEPPRPYISSHKPLYTRQQILILSNAAASKSQSSADELFTRPMDELVRRDVYIIPPPQSSTGYQPMRKYFIPSDLKIPNSDVIMNPTTQERRHSDSSDSTQIASPPTPAAADCVS